MHMRIKIHFDEIHVLTEDSQRSPFWEYLDSLESQDPVLNNLIKTVKLEEILPAKQHNLSKAQYKGLRELSDNPHIVCKIVDSVVCKAF